MRRISQWAREEGLGWQWAEAIERNRLRYGSVACSRLLAELFLFFDGHLGINEDTAAELANEDFLACADVELALCGNLAVATAATVALYLHYGETVVCVLADTLEGGEETLIDVLLQLGGAEHERFGLVLCLGEYGV